MYYWNISNAKKELSKRSFSDREVLPYVVLYTVLSMLAAFPIQMDEEYYTNNTLIDMMTWLIASVIAVLGIFFLYRCNGAAFGKDFLQRLFVLGFIVMIRLTPWLLVALIFIIPVSVIMLSVGNMQYALILESCLIVAFEVVYTWIVGKHIKDVASVKVEN